MAELTEEERAKLPDSAFADPEKRAYPIQDEEHARAALARVKQHGTKDEQKKVARKVHERYPNIQLGQYFMALLGLVLVTALVGTWIRGTQGHYLSFSFSRFLAIFVIKMWIFGSLMGMKTDLLWLKISHGLHSESKNSKWCNCGSDRSQELRTSYPHRPYW